MSEATRDLEAFARAVDALEPYLSGLVFIGGWAQFLYTLRPEANAIPFEPLLTLDLDVAAPSQLPIGEHGIGDLLRRAGFREQFSGDHRPPISEFVLGDENVGGFFLEFLAPLEGGESKRGGRLDGTTTIAGVTAQKLRFLELLLVEPWRVTLTGSSGFPLKTAREVQIPNAAAYVVQKMLVLSRRRTEDQAKDLLYIHDTFATFSDAHEAVRDAWQALRATMHQAHVRSFQKAIDDTVTMNDLVRRAARIAAARPSAPTPEALLLGLREGFESCFGIPRW